MLRKIGKWLAWLLGGAAALLVLFYLMLLAVNWRDAEPSATALRFAERYAQRPVVADNENGFLYAVGMSGEAGSEPISAAVAMVARAREPQGNSAPSYEYSHPDYPQLDFSKSHDKQFAELLERCKSIDEKCLAILGADTATTLQFSSTDKLLLERYRTLTGFEGWREIYPRGFNGPIFPYASAIVGQRLSLYEIWRNAPARGAVDTLMLLEQDQQFWHRVLSNSDTLVSSMLALRALRRNLYWSNLVSRHLASNNGRMEFTAAWFPPLTVEAQTLQRPWVGEWAMAEPMLRNAYADGLSMMEGREGGASTAERLAQKIWAPLYQAQDTINRRAEEFDELITRYNVPYEQVAQVSSGMREASLGFGGEGLSFPHLFYNPIGKVLNAIASADSEEYLLKAADLEGARRALLATLELRNNKTPRNKVAEALAASSYRNPYSNQPFTWEEATGSVVFEGLGEGKSRRYSFIY